jgi:hypothetical protein
MKVPWGFWVGLRFVGGNALLVGDVLLLGFVLTGGLGGLGKI